jgi:hypothetical protein
VPEGKRVNIYCGGVITNRGRADGKQPGAAITVLYHQEREWRHTESVFGEMITQSNTLHRALIPKLDRLQVVRACVVWKGRKSARIPIIGPRAQLDTSPHDGQDTTIQCLRKLGDILHAFPNIAIRLVWLPKKAPFIDFRRAKQLAVEAIRTANLTEIKEPQTASKTRRKRPRKPPAPRGRNASTTLHTHPWYTRQRSRNPQTGERTPHSAQPPQLAPQLRHPRRHGHHKESRGHKTHIG